MSATLFEPSQNKNKGFWFRGFVDIEDNHAWIMENFDQGHTEIKSFQSISSASSINPGFNKSHGESTMHIANVLNRVRSQKPLVHHITNWVTIYDCANMTRAFGAFPVMAHAKEESGDMAKIASSLVLNIGTLTPELVDSMVIAGKAANEKGIPIILDAVGVGATRLRDDEAFRLLNSLRISMIKGNASEIARLAGEDVMTRGVEASEVAADLVEVARRLAKEREATIIVTGVTDIVTDGERTYLIRNGHEMMGVIVGTGCMAASVLGAFAGVENDHVTAAVSALVSYELAGELAAERSRGPGSFKENFYDEVYNLTLEKVEAGARVEQG